MNHYCPSLQVVPLPVLVIQQSFSECSRMGRGRRVGEEAQQGTVSAPSPGPMFCPELHSYKLHHMRGGNASQSGFGSEGQCKQLQMGALHL